ncbi:MAG: methyltransferase domain-containing protein [Acidimicrobiales bacterium]|nr:methyltransferase domain-containing protein [Acidimicrobiales bacterium]
MTDTEEVLRYLHQAKQRVEGGSTQPSSGEEAVRYARHRLEEALPHAHAGSEIPADARLRPVKNAMLGAVRPVTSHQAPFNTAILQALDGATAAIESMVHRVELQDHHGERLSAGLATAEIALDEVIEDLNALRLDVRSHLESFSSTLEELRASVDEAKSIAATTRAQQEVVLRIAQEALSAQGFTVEHLSELTRELGSGYERLYEDLEDTFRGSLESVRASLEPYLEDLAATKVEGDIVDVGCGRGEWLSLLKDHGIASYGVDTNEVVVERCVDAGLDVRHQDALVHLRTIEPGSLRAVTSFHVVEHLPLDVLVGLIDAALIALAPGGVLIFETPNPTNLNVGAASFYLDPTHLKPLHPQFLEFLVKQRGFTTVEARFLHPSNELDLNVDDLAAGGTRDRAQGIVDRINWAFGGPMDFAIVAHKATSSEA